jgi:adenylylsulfate kinase-like enzyme
VSAVMILIGVSGAGRASACWLIHNTLRDRNKNGSRIDGVAMLI